MSDVMKKVRSILKTERWEGYGLHPNLFSLLRRKLCMDKDLKGMGWVARSNIFPRLNSRVKKKYKFKDFVLFYF